MHYHELENRDRNYINGKLSRFMDAYIRQNKVWTPAQMHESFFEMITKELSNNWFTTDCSASKVAWSSENAIRWLTSDNGSEFALVKFRKKYEKDKPIALRKSPLVERVRFGLGWDESKYYDVNFGLKGGYDFIGTKNLENLQYIPWSIEHINSELATKYDSTLITCLSKLSTSHLEVLFVDYWKTHFYINKNNPAIIPEVCGLRPKFYYYELDDKIYATSKEMPAGKCKCINFRYDFLVANFQKQKIAFVELDGFEFHKTRKQQTIDSIKRNNAAKHNIALLVFTSKMIIENIAAVFLELDDYLHN